MLSKDNELFERAFDVLNAVYYEGKQIGRAHV